MNVLYEESGVFKVGSIVLRHESNLQIDTQHGKRAKLKAANLFLEFNSPLNDFLPNAERLAAEMDLVFLWECSPDDEFDYSVLAHDYWGPSPSPVEMAAIILRLFQAPIYFYKKGKGRYKKAPIDAIQAALAGLERKQRENTQIQEWVAQLKQHHLPEAIQSQLMALLWKPNKNTIEYKALEQAARECKLSPTQLAYEAGGIPSIPDYLLAGFKLEYFPKGFGFDNYNTPTWPTTLPEAPVKAFSIDDASTTEIDDAFSLTTLPDGNIRVGIHIACPAFVKDPAIDAIVLNRLSTVYYPGSKITMLPPDWVKAFTLQAGKHCLAFSLYVTVNSALEPILFENQIEMVYIQENLRLDTLEPVFNAATLAAEHPPTFPFQEELTWLWHFANALEKRRGKYDPNRVEPLDYNFTIVDDKVVITPRKRGAPIDKLVSELMILANSEWGRLLAEAKIPALYRAQTTGKVHMTTRPEAHVGLGVKQYIWATSPLRRASDFINQRQLIALAQGTAPDYTQDNVDLFAILRDFETAYTAYNQFQDRMERYWCLRWLQQENINEPSATYLKDDLIQLDHLPLRIRLAGLPPLSAGNRIQLSLVRIDELTQEIELRFLRVLNPPAVSSTT